MSKEKRKWETPKLICLCRGRPEEAVLQTCKTPDLPGPPDVGHTKCKDKGTWYCDTVTQT